MSLDEIQAHANVLILAGSETTATTLSGTTYLLCTHPAVLSKLAAEVRTTFKSEREIDLFSVQKLPYMLAVLDEAMRVYPPVPSAIPRTTPCSGNVVLGEYLPGNVSNTPADASTETSSASGGAVPRVGGLTIRRSSWESGNGP